MQNHPLVQRTLHFIRCQQLIPKHSAVLAAVSGGADSVALLHLLMTLAVPLSLRQITVLHFDHQLRGRDSDQDRLFVEALAKRLGLQCITGRQDVAAFRRSHGISLEMAARSCRHRFFQETLAQLPAHCVALGHTANDQAEELLLRLLHGTGPSGMAGMAPRTPQNIIRPLLFATRRQILDYLTASQLEFREDLSNQEPFCQRNVLRLKVFPLLEQAFHGRIVQTLARHARLAGEEEEYWNGRLQKLWPTVCLAATTTRVVLDRAGLLRLEPVLLRRTLRWAIAEVQGDLLGIGTVHLQLMSRWAHRAGSGKSLQLPGNLHMFREGDRIVLSTQAPFRSTPFRWEIPAPGNYTFPSLHLHISLRRLAAAAPESCFGTDQQTACLDAAALRWPLFVRSWQPGDRFHPLGLGGSKKLQDFFTDHKISRTLRNRVPLLCDQEKICWIIGYRLDDRVKVTSATKELIRVESFAE